MIRQIDSEWTNHCLEQACEGTRSLWTCSIPVKIREECYSDSGAGIKGTVYVREHGNSVGRVTVVFVPKLLRLTKRRCHLVYPGVFGFDWDKVTCLQIGQWVIRSELGI